MLRGILMKSVIKTLIILFLIILIICIFYNFIWSKFQNKHRFEKSTIQMSESLENSPFSLAKVILYSSAYGNNKNTTFQQTNWILDIFQYTDIAIYIKNTENELNSSNSVKKLFLENISISTPKLGSPNLYYLNTLNFGTPHITEHNKIDTSLEFTVLNDPNQQNNIQYNTPIFFTDCSNPITLKYVNHPIKENFEITSNEPVFFNGKLLKMANINLSDLETTISFTIRIINHNNEEYSYHVSLPIHLTEEENSMDNGNILVEKTYKNLKFIKQL